MSAFLERYGSWGLVAGAGEGLGRAYALALAKRQMHVVLVDRDADSIQALSEELKKAWSIETLPIHLDLSTANAPIALMQQINDLDCRLVVFNAAYGPVKAFMHNTAEELDYYLNLNARFPLQFLRLFVDRLIKEKKSGGAILMSSLAGLYGTQLVTPYGATKAFDYNLAEGLHYELKELEIDILACCAGAMDTPNYRNTQPEYGRLKPKVMAPEPVAESALRQLGKRPLYIPGFSNQLTYFLFTRVFNRKQATKLLNRTMGKMYQKKKWK